MTSPRIFWRWWCRHWPVVCIVGVLCALIAAGVWLGARASGREAASAAAFAANRAVLNADAASCDRNQIQRTYDRVDEAHQRAIVDAVNMLRDTRFPTERKPRPLRQAPVIAPVYLGIVNCGATFSEANVRVHGDPVYLQRGDERCFIQLVITHYFQREAPTTNPKLLRSICAR